MKLLTNQMALFSFQNPEDGEVVVNPKKQIKSKLS